MKNQVFLLCACLLFTGCHSSGVRVRHLAEDAQLRAAYENAAASEELAALLQADLAEHRVADAYQGLKAFTTHNLEARHASRAHSIFEGARPVVLFQFHGGATHVSAVKQLGELLRSEAETEVSDLYDRFDARDLESLRRLSSDPLGVLHPDTVRLSADLAPHAAFFRGYLAYEDLGARGMLSKSDAEEIAGLMQRAGEVFARTGQDERLFLTYLVSAQALELAGDRDAAIERWKAALDSEFWPHADADVRAAIAARISSYRERLRQEVEAEVAEERREEIRKLEEEYARRNSESLDRIAELERKLDQAREEIRAVRDSEEKKKIELLDQQLQRVLELARLDRSGETSKSMDELEGAVNGAVDWMRDAVGHALVDSTLAQPAPVGAARDPDAAEFDWQACLTRLDTVLSIAANGVALWQTTRSRG